MPGPDSAPPSGSLEPGAIQRQAGHFDVAARAFLRDDSSTGHGAAATVQGLELRAHDQSLTLRMAHALFDQGMTWLPHPDGHQLQVPALLGHEIELALRFSSPGPDAGNDPDRWRWLDGLTGVLNASLDAQLTLPLLGRRTLRQRLHVPVTSGTFRFRELTTGLGWLHSKFIELGVDADRVTLSWRLPLVGPFHEIASWPLDQSARASAVHGRLPLRTLLGPRRVDGSTPPPSAPVVLEHLEARELSLSASVLSQHPLTLAGGTLTLGTTTEPGIRDAELHGHLVRRGAGSLHGSIQNLSAAVQGIAVAGASLTVERMCLGPVRTLGLTFEGFRPVELRLHADKVEMTDVHVVC